VALDLLLDWRVPARARDELEQRGVNAVHVGDLEPRPRSPHERLAAAKSEDRVLVTGDYAGVGEAANVRGGEGRDRPLVLFVGSDRDLADVAALADDLAAWAAKVETDWKGGEAAWLD